MVADLGEGSEDGICSGMNSLKYPLVSRDSADLKVRAPTAPRRDGKNIDANGRGVAKRTWRVALLRNRAGIASMPG